MVKIGPRGYSLRLAPVTFLFPAGQGDRVTSHHPLRSLLGGG